MMFYNVFVCFLACFIQSSLCQVIGYPGLVNNVGLANGLPLGLGAGNAIAATNAAANVAAIEGLNGLTLGNLPISAVSPMNFGDVAVGGELAVGGSTAVAGNVPVIGYVMFEGYVPAGGTVQLASNCGCP